MVSHPVIDYMLSAAPILRDSLAAGPGETAVIITDGSGDEDFVTSLQIEFATRVLSQWS